MTARLVKAVLLFSFICLGGSISHLTDEEWQSLLDSNALSSVPSFVVKEPIQGFHNLVAHIDEISAELTSAVEELKNVKAQVEASRHAMSDDLADVAWYNLQKQYSIREKYRKAERKKDALSMDIAAPLFKFLKNLHYLNDLNEAVKKNDKVLGEDGKPLVSEEQLGRLKVTLHDSVENLVLLLPEDIGKSIRFNLRKRLYAADRQLDKMSLRVAESRKEIMQAQQDEYCSEESILARQQDRREVEELAGDEYEILEDADEETVGTREIRIASELSFEEELKQARHNRKKSNAQEAAEAAGWSILTGISGSAYWMRRDISNALPHWPNEKEYVDMPQAGIDWDSAEALVDDIGQGFDMIDEGTVHAGNGIEVGEVGVEKMNRITTAQKEVERSMRTSQNLMEQNKKLTEDNKALVDQNAAINQQAASRRPPGHTAEEERQIQRNNDQIEANSKNVRENADKINDERKKTEAALRELEGDMNEISQYKDEVEGIADYVGRVMDLGKSIETNGKALYQSLKATFVDWPTALWENITIFAAHALPELLMMAADFLVLSLTGPFFILLKARTIYKLIKWATKPPAFKRSEFCNPDKQKTCCLRELERLENFHQENGNLELTERWNTKQGHVSNADCRAVSAHMRTHLQDYSDGGNLRSVLESSKVAKKEEFCDDNVLPYLYCGFEECGLCSELSQISMTKGDPSKLCDAFHVPDDSFLSIDDDGKVLDYEKIDGPHRHDIVREKKCRVIHSHLKKYGSYKRLRDQETFPLPICVESGFCVDEGFYPTPVSSVCNDCKRMVIRALIGSKPEKVCASIHRGFKERKIQCEETLAELKVMEIGMDYVTEGTGIFGRQEHYESTDSLLDVLPYFPAKAPDMCMQWCSDDDIRIVTPRDGGWATSKYANTENSVSTWEYDDEGESRSKKALRKIRSIRKKSTVEDLRKELRSHISGSLTKFSEKSRKFKEVMEKKDKSRINKGKSPVGGATGQVVEATSQLFDHMVEALQQSLESLQKFKSLYHTKLLEESKSDDTNSDAGPDEQNPKGHALLELYMHDYETAIASMGAIIEKYKTEELPRFVLPDSRSSFSLKSSELQTKGDVESRLKEWNDALRCQNVLYEVLTDYSAKMDEVNVAFEAGVTYLRRIEESGSVDQKLDFKSILKILKKIHPEELLEAGEGRLHELQKDLLGDEVLIGRNDVESCFLDSYVLVNDIAKGKGSELVAIANDIRKVKALYKKEGEMSKVQLLWTQAASLATALSGELNYQREEVDQKMAGLRELSAYLMEHYRLGRGTTKFFEKARSTLTSEIDESIKVWNVALEKVKALRALAVGPKT